MALFPSVCLLRPSSLPFSFCFSLCLLPLSLLLSLSHSLSLFPGTVYTFCAFTMLPSLFACASPHLDKTLYSLKDILWTGCDNLRFHCEINVKPDINLMHLPKTAQAGCLLYCRHIARLVVLSETHAHVLSAEALSLLEPFTCYYLIGGSFWWVTHSREKGVVSEFQLEGMVILYVYVGTLNYDSHIDGPENSLISSFKSYKRQR